MLFSGLTAIAHNQNRRKQNLKLFEFGKTYSKKSDSYQENTHLSLLVTGNQFENNWTSQANPSGFYYLKGVCESILNRIGIKGYKQVETNEKLLSEGISFQKDGEILLSLGVVDKSFATKLGIKNEVLFADFNWNLLKSLASKNTIVYEELPKFPEVNRDFALLLDENIPFKELYSIALNTERKFLKNVNLFDVYTGKNLPEGKKSYAVSFTLLDTTKTLTDKQIDKIMSKLQNAYVEQLGAELR